MYKNKPDSYYQSLDKRTKEYREYKEYLQSQKSEGLGDTIEKVTKATGIKKAVDYVFDKLGKDCGCDERKEKLNKMFRYRKPKCLEQEEYEYLHEFFTSNTNIVRHQTQLRLLEIYNRVFDTNKKKTSCAPCIKSTIDELRTIYKEY